MAEENLKLEYGPSSETYFYPPPVPCRDCGGSGKIALLVTARACGACEGSGQIQGKPIRHEHVPAQLGYWHCDRTFDELGRVITEIRWFEPVADAGQGPEAGGGPASGSGPGEKDGPRK